MRSLSEIIWHIKSNNIDTKACADILYMLSYTETYFACTSSYKQFSSEEVSVRRCDTNPDDKYKKGKKILVYEEESAPIYKGVKVYDTEYIWG